MIQTRSLRISADKPLIQRTQIEPSSQVLSGMVLATDPGDPPVVWDWTSTTGPFGSRPVQNPDLLPVGGPNRDLCGRKTVRTTTNPRN